MDVLGQIDLAYWQLTSSEPMPDSFDVAIIEGAVTTKESYDTVCKAREIADKVIAVGSCATVAGIPGIAANHFANRIDEVYQRTPDACGEMLAPRSVTSIIPVDYCVLSCPIDFYEFCATLHAALYGSNRHLRSTTMCNECKRKENVCFYERGEICLGLITNGGCGAKCPSLNRPCNGCRGFSPQANIASARMTVSYSGLSVEEFDKKLEIFNQTNTMLSESRGV